MKAPTIAELRAMSDEDLIQAHDAMVSNVGGVGVGISYVLDELSRRRTEALTKTVVRLTWVIVLLTLASLIAALVAIASS